MINFDLAIFFYIFDLNCSFILQSTSKNSFSQKYFLRKRSPKPLPYNQTVYFESPGSFGKTVKSLEKITRKNSLLTRNNIKEEKTSPVCDM